MLEILISYNTSHWPVKVLVSMMSRTMRENTSAPLLVVGAKPPEAIVLLCLRSWGTGSVWPKSLSLPLWAHQPSHRESDHRVHQGASSECELMHTLSLGQKPHTILFTNRKVYDLTLTHCHDIVDNDTLSKKSTTERQLIEFHALTRTPAITPPAHCTTAI